MIKKRKIIFMVTLLCSVLFVVGCIHEQTTVQQPQEEQPTGPVPGSLIVYFERDNYDAVVEQVVAAGLSYDRDSRAFSRTVYLNLGDKNILEQLEGEESIQTCYDRRNQKSFQLDWDAECFSEPDVEDSTIQALMESYTITEFEIKQRERPFYLGVTVEEGQEEYWIQEISTWPLVQDVSQDYYIQAIGY